MGRHFGEASVPEGECGPCPVFRVIPWHSPYNRGKITEKPVRVVCYCRQNVVCILLSRPSNKSWRLRRGWNLALRSLLWHSAQLGRQSCQLYTSAALYLQGNSLVLISVRSWVDHKASECEQKDYVTWKCASILPVYTLIVSLNEPRPRAISTTPSGLPVTLCYKPAQSSHSLGFGI
jgi:hypothetical protein